MLPELTSLKAWRGWVMLGACLPPLPPALLSWAALVLHVLSQDSWRSRAFVRALRQRRVKGRKSAAASSSPEEDCPHPQAALYRSGNQHGSFIHCSMCRARVWRCTVEERDAMKNEQKRATARRNRLELLTRGRTETGGEHTMERPRTSTQAASSSSSWETISLG